MNTVLTIPEGTRVSADIAPALRAWMARERLTAETGAKVLRVNRRTLEGWLAGRRCPHAIEILKEIQK
jgi:hypothetical protein